MSHDAPGAADAEATTRLRDRASALARRPGVWIAIAVLLIAGVLGYLQRRGPLVDVAVVRRSDIEQHLIASGRVRVVTRVQVNAQQPGRVTKVAVREGQQVAPGDLLAQIDDREAQAEVQQARAAVSQARGGVERVREVGVVLADEQVREADANLTRAQADFARVDALVRAGAAATRELEEARRTLDVARAAARAARAQRQANTAQGAESRVAVSALRESEARLAAAELRLAQTRVVASQAGVILARLVDPGDIVRTGDALLELAGEGETEIVIEPDERNLAWLRVGQTGKASSDAYPGQVFDAEVAYIAPAVNRQRGSIEVRLRVPDPPATLRPDMTVSVDLTVASEADALTVPSAAIRDAATSSPYVFVVEDDAAVQREVRLGIAGEGQSEIASGVPEGALVVLATERPLDSGQRVRVRQAP